MRKERESEGKEERKGERERRKKTHENSAVDFIHLCGQWVHALD